MPINFEYHYVLFLDILGYSAIIGRASSGPDHQDGAIEALQKSFQSARSRFSDKPNYDIKQFSDSIILSSPYSSTQADEFIYESAQLQISILKQGILTRGGLSIGKHFQDQDFVASQAVIDAYYIEQKTAKYPRVVTDGNFLDTCYPDGNYGDAPIASYIDGVKFVDYLRSVDDIENTRLSLLNIWVNSEKLDWASREKVHWIVDYWNSRFPSHEISMPQRFEFL